MGGSDWRELRLGDVAHVKHGFAFDGQYFTDEPSADVLLTPGNFAIGGGFKADKLKYYQGPVPAEFVLRAGDLVVTMTDLSKESDTLGYAAIVPQSEKRRYLHNQRIGRVEVASRDAVEPAFLHWLLRGPKYRAEVLAGATGTTVKHTAPSRIEAYRFSAPPLSQQRAIARILDAIEAKIELNRSANETLEEMARTVFKSWFVDFDPVQAKFEGKQPVAMNAETAALFPSEFEGALPKGWRTEPLSKSCESIFSGGTPSTTTLPFWGGGIPWLSSGETRERFIIDTEKTITQAGVAGSTTRMARAGATVIASAGQGHTRGQASMLMLDAYINQSVIALAANQQVISDEFLFFDLDRRYEQFRQLSDGNSSRGSLTGKLLGDLRCVVPTLPLIDVFSRFAGPVVAKIAQCRRESFILTELRDTLLPKLISGEVGVPDAEKVVSSVA